MEAPSTQILPPADAAAPAVVVVAKKTRAPKRKYTNSNGIRKTMNAVSKSHSLKRESYPVAEAMLEHGVARIAKAGATCMELDGRKILTKRDVASGCELVLSGRLLAKVSGRLKQQQDEALPVVPKEIEVQPVA